MLADVSHQPGLPPTERRSPKELLAAAKAFGKESVPRSWFHVFETFIVMGVLQAIVIMTKGNDAVSLAVRVVAAIVLGLTIVRGFILYHDFLHNAILRGSTMGKIILYPFGTYLMTPPNVWKQTHNYHHAHTAKLVGSHVGSYLMVSTAMWEKMSAKERFMYKAIRHPLTIFFAYFTVFMWGMAVASFVRNPIKNWDSLLALLINWGLTASIWFVFGFQMFFFAMFLPLFVAMMVGAYLFYAQHNFPEADVQPRDTWEFTKAALDSSSYMKMGPIMTWFTGNIGYHHVHHLNSGIPFYRLKEAMDAIPELQHPTGVTTLALKDIVACFNQKLWDPQAGRMVGYP